MSDFTDVDDWRGRTVVDGDGEKIGKLDEIYLDRDTNRPEWALVNTGLFGTKSSFVPLEGAARSGEDVRVAYPKEQVKDAPSIDADGELSRPRWIHGCTRGVDRCGQNEPSTPPGKGEYR
jgi:sporulation protein YlmC with PRC-barrel domain